MDDDWQEGEGLVCPYCGEQVEPVVEEDASPNDSYVEDCPVCCRPWTVVVARGESGVRIQLLRADD
jgi:hypothetical protein